MTSHLPKPLTFHLPNSTDVSTVPTTSVIPSRPPQLDPFQESQTFPQSPNPNGLSSVPTNLATLSLPPSKDPNQKTQTTPHIPISQDPNHASQVFNRSHLSLNLQASKSDCHNVLPPPSSPLNFSSSHPRNDVSPSWMIPKPRPPTNLSDTHSANPSTIPSIYFENFPSSWNAADLKRIFLKFASITEVYVARKKTKYGRQFSFIRVQSLTDVDRLIHIINGLYIGTYKLKATVSRFQ